jgi:hypothetical protein
VSVHPSALVSGRDIRKPMRSLDCELFEDFHLLPLRNTQKLVDL